MAGFDQLGLFSNNAGEKFDKLNSFPSRKLNIAVETISANDQKIDDAIRKFTKEVESLSGNVVVASKNADREPWANLGFFAIDVETTGLDAASHRVIEIALVPFNMPDEVKPFSKLFAVGEPLSPEIVQITGISDAMLKNQPSFGEHADECLKLMRRAAFVVAYNAKFDRPFLESEMARLGKVLPHIPWIDPFVFICEIDRFKRGKKLSDAARRWGVNLENAHRARADAQAAGELLLKMADKIGGATLDELIAKQKILSWQNAHNMAELKRSSSWAINR